MAGGSGDKLLDLQQLLVPGNSMKTSVTSVGTSAAVTLVATPLSRRCRVYLTTSNTIQVYVGNASVTASTGFPLVQNVPLPLPINDGVLAYVIADGLTSVRVLEMS